MKYKINDKVVCIVDTNKHLELDKIYDIYKITSGGFISVRGVYDKNRNYVYINPDLHFKPLNRVRKEKLDRLYNE